MTATNVIICQQYLLQAAEATYNVNKVNIFANNHVNYPQLPVSKVYSVCIIHFYQNIHVHTKIN